jgi:hypothetical protein
MSPQHNSFCVKSCTPNSLPDRQGRNDTLRALKRKIQENFTTCKPTKIPICCPEKNGDGNMFEPVPTIWFPSLTAGIGAQNVDPKKKSGVLDAYSANSCPCSLNWNALELFWQCVIFFFSFYQ